VRETALQTPKSVKKEGEEVLQVLEQIPQHPVMKTMVRQAAHLQPMEVHGGGNIHLAACGEPHTRVGGDALKEATDSGELMLE